MTSLYAQFATDKKVEKEGVVLEYGFNSKNKPISIRIARAGGSNVRYNKLLEAKTKPYRQQLRNETLDNAVAEKLTQEVYVDTVMLGWENVEFPVLDEQGAATGQMEELPFTKANCLRLFKDLPDLWADIQTQANRAALFRAEILEADSKN